MKLRTILAACLLALSIATTVDAQVLVGTVPQVPIGALPPAGPITGSELLAIQQNGQAVQTPVNKISGATVIPEPANTFQAGPTSGGPAVPTYRLIVGGDLPLFSSGAPGAVPSPGAATGRVLFDNATWGPIPGGGSCPAGSSGQIQYNNSGSCGGFTASGDATINTGTGVVTVTGIGHITGGTLAVGNGGTGDTTFTANLPLIGNGTSAIGQGTVSGSTTKFVTTTGTLTSGDCAKWDASGNAIDNGAVCGQAPGGSSGQLQINSTGSFAGITLGGDCTFSTPNITCTKTNGTAFAAVATSGSASDLGAGTLPAARLPNPSASTLGGIESITCSPSNWINTISTLGVPSCTRPGFSDLSGNISVSQMNGGVNASASTVWCGNQQWCTPAGGGNVNGPATSTAGDVACWNNTIGSLLSDCGPQGVIITEKTGTYTIGAGDAYTYVVLTSGSFTFTMPQAGTTGFEAKKWFCLANSGSGVLTVSYTTSTVFGALDSTSFPQNTGICLISNGTADSASGTYLGIDQPLGMGTFFTLTNGVYNPSSVSANTMYGNWTGGTAVPQFNAMPSCPDSGGQHLNYNSGSGGIICGTTTGGTGSVTSVAPGAGIATSNTGGTSAITSTGTLFLDCSYVPTFLGGLTLSNDGVTPTTIIDTAAGAACSDDNVTAMKLAAFTKTTGAWAVGSGNGCLDTGSIANTTWYHVFVIERTDTSVVDELCSTSTSPTMPTNYSKKRRVGSFKTDGSAHIWTFKQVGNIFYLGTPVLDVNDAALTTAMKNETLGSVPPGVKVMPLCRYTIGNAGNAIILVSGDEPSQTPTTTTPFSAAPGFDQLDVNLTNGDQNAMCPMVTTDTSQNLQARSTAAATQLSIVTRGWID